MPEVSVFNIEGSKVGKIALSEEIFNVKINSGIIHDTVINHLTSVRKGTACTKTRSEVSGGGRKPWRQKGTGRARAGSIRSPLWRGGGVVFGPKPRDYSFSLPKKVKRLAVKGILSYKVAEDLLIVTDDFKISQPKTKELFNVLSKFSYKKLLLVTEDKDIIRAARNIPNVKTIHPSNLNAYSLLDCDKILMPRTIIENLQSGNIKIDVEKPEKEIKCSSIK